MIEDKELTPGRVHYAGKDVRGALSDLENGATWLDKVSRDDSQYADLLNPISAELWRMTYSVRELERRLATIRAEIREADAK